jgi:replicative DNA helicase
MNYYDSRQFIFSISRGKKGLNKGLSSGFDKLDTITYGVQRKWMTIYAGDSGRNCRL